MHLKETFQSDTFQIVRLVLRFKGRFQFISETVTLLITLITVVKLAITLKNILNIFFLTNAYWSKFETFEEDNKGILNQFFLRVFKTSVHTVENVMIKKKVQKSFVQI